MFHDLFRLQTASIVIFLPEKYAHITDLPEENFTKTSHELDSFLQQQSQCVLKRKGREMVI